MDIDSLRKLIGTPRDSAMLRLTLARLLARLLAQQDALEEAVTHLEAAVVQDPAYTAAWKELGRLRLRAGRTEAARDAWTRGMEQAVRHGDKQAEKEMTVFLRRLEKAADSD